MASVATELLSALRKFALQQNPDVLRDYPPADALTIWTEGGEWPAYSADYEEYQANANVRDINEVNYSYTTSVDDAVQYVASALDAGDVVGVSMDCGQGKSTHLVRALHNLKYGRRTVSVQPSSLVAAELTSYLDKPDVVFVQSRDHMLDKRAIYYMSAGVLLDLIAVNRIADDDLIVMDEAHSATLVHTIVYDMLNRMTNYLVLMTASTSPDVKVRKGVKLHAVSASADDPRMATSIDSNALVIGVNSDSTYAYPASMLTGLTIPGLLTVYDTGLRPDPRTQYGSVFPGERKASVAEITQSMGRLGRQANSGTGFYVHDARPLRKQFGISLYTLMASVIGQALGLSSGASRSMTVRVWKHSGVIDPTCATESHKSGPCSDVKSVNSTTKLTKQSLSALNDKMSSCVSVRSQDAVSQVCEWRDNLSRKGDPPSVTTARVNYRVDGTHASVASRSCHDSRPADRYSGKLPSLPDYSASMQQPAQPCEIPSTSASTSVDKPTNVDMPTQVTADPTPSLSKETRARVDKGKSVSDGKRTSIVSSHSSSRSPSSIPGSQVSEWRNAALRKAVKSQGSSGVVSSRASSRDDTAKIDIHATSLSSKSKQASGTSVAQKRVESRLIARRPSSKIRIDLDIERQISLSRHPKSGRLTMTTGIVMPNTRECIVQGDAAWARLFRKGAEPVIPEGKIDSALVRSYWESIVDSMHNYDSIFPSVLPVVDPRQVTLKTIDNANKVVSFDRLPTYSEQEILSVIALWNKYVVSLRGRSAAYDRLYNFIDYFDTVYGFGHTTSS